MNHQRWLIGTDFHIPYHDPRMVQLWIDLGIDINPTHVFLNGDFLDFYNLNMHGPKDPQVVESLLDELNQGREIIKIIRDSFPNAKIIFNAGNHEYRLDRYILKNCKAFLQLMSVKNELCLDSLNIEYYPYNTAYNIVDTNIWIQHSPPSYSQNAARTSLLKKMSGSFIWGCTHRPDSAYLSSYDGLRHEAHCLGWLGSTTLTDSHKAVFSYTKGHESWGNSFATIDIINNQHFIQHHLIKDYKTVVNGSYYEG